MLEQLDLRQRQLPGLEAEEQDVSFFENLPYSDFRRWVPEDSIYEEAQQQIPALGRLQHIKALSFLSYLGPKSKEAYFTGFTHTRLDHVLTVALITEEILKRNGFPQDQINLGIITSLLHDIATPAYGDAVKQIDPQNLHEENYWWEVLDKKGKDFVSQFGTRDTLDGIIKNQGLLGQILDISDRITYTMKDLAGVQRTPSLVGPDPHPRDLDYLIALYPKIGNIYQDVGVDQKKQTVFFNNPDNLAAFLYLRAHLHQNLYLHPTNQARDLFIAKAVSQLYSVDGPSILSPARLRQMKDEDLMEVIASRYKKFQVPIHLILTNWSPEFKKFYSIAEAKNEEKKLKRRRKIITIGTKECKGFDPATHYKVADGYQYFEFRENNPSESRQIEEIAKQTQGIYLFWMNVSEKPEINNLLKAVLIKK